MDWRTKIEGRVTNWLDRATGIRVVEEEQGSPDENDSVSPGAFLIEVEADETPKHVQERRQEMRKQAQESNDG